MTPLLHISQLRFFNRFTPPKFFCLKLIKTEQLEYLPKKNQLRIGDHHIMLMAADSRSTTVGAN